MLTNKIKIYAISLVAIACAFIVTPSFAGAITVDTGAMPISGGTQWPTNRTTAFSSGVQFQMARNIRATSTSLRLMYINNTGSTTTFMASVRKSFAGTPEIVTVNGTSTIVMLPYTATTSDVLSFSAVTGDILYDRSFFQTPLTNQTFSASLYPATNNPESITVSGSWNASHAINGWATTSSSMLLVTDKSFEVRIPAAALSEAIFAAYAVLGVPTDTSMRFTTFVGDSKTTDALPDNGSASKPWANVGMVRRAGDAFQNLAIAGDALRYLVRPQESTTQSSYTLRQSLVTQFGGDVVNHYGTNSVGNGIVPATAASQELGYISELKSLITTGDPTGRLFQATLDSTARKTSTSSWSTITEADQSGAGDGNNGIATSVYFNNLLKTDKPNYIDGVIDLASMTMTPNGYWKPGMTGDGIHQNNTANALQGAYFDSLWPIPGTAGSTITSVSTSTATTTATIAWSTNRSADTRLRYGANNSVYQATTTDSATSTSHTVTLSSLAPCTRYNFQIESFDVYFIRATSTNQNFHTGGCTGSATVATSTDGVTITTASGGTLSFGTSTVVVPTGFTGTSSSAVFQARQLDHAAFRDVAGTPTGKTPAGTYVLNLTALTNATTTLSEFDNPISITLAYTAEDIDGLDESALKIYRYDAGTGWTILSNCTVDTGARTVTCTTTHFSEFAIFGEAAVVASSGSGAAISTFAPGGLSGYSTVTYGCKDPVASNYQSYVAHNPSSCVYSNGVKPSIVVASSAVNSAGTSGTIVTTTSVSTPFVAIQKFLVNLQSGMIHPDVKRLQQFLNQHGTTVSVKGAGSVGKETTTFGPATKNAVIRFQKAKGIVPAVGYFGPITRKAIEAVK